MMIECILIESTGRSPLDMETVIGIIDMVTIPMKDDIIYYGVDDSEMEKMFVVDRRVFARGGHDRVILLGSKVK